MNETKARKIIEAVMIRAQKARSDITESMGDLGEEFLKPLTGYLFGELNLVDACERMLKKEHVRPLDLFNILYMVEKTPSIAVLEIFYGHPDVPIPAFEPPFSWQVEWDEVDE